jgi:hypothetical protein
LLASEGANKRRLVVIVDYHRVNALGELAGAVLAGEGGDGVLAGL